MQPSLRLMLAGVAALALPLEAAAADRLLNPRVCERRDLSEATQKRCESIAGLRGRDRFKARVLERLRRKNRPPVAELRLARTLDEQTILPGRVDLDAGDSTDQDGFVAYYDLQMFDDDTGLLLGRVITTRHPLTTIHVPQGLPPNLLAVLTVTDDVGATDTTELAFTSDGTLKD